MDNLISRITDKDIGEKYIKLNNPKTRNGSRGIVLRSDGKIAVFNITKKNLYKLPGGGMEDNETPEEAFKREVLEETRCQVEVIKKVGIIEEYKSRTNFKHISYVFVGRVIKDTGILHMTKNEQDEGVMLLWETPKKALELITNCYNYLDNLDYVDIYMKKFIVLRDKKILECYISNE